MCVFAFELRSLWAKDSSHGWPVDVFSGLRGAAKMPHADFVDLTQDTFFFFNPEMSHKPQCTQSTGVSRAAVKLLVFP